MTTHTPQAMPVKIGPFSAHEKVAEGGMGEIWRGEDTRSGEAVAIKRLRGLDGDHAARLLREGRALARLEHAHVVRMLDVGGNDGTGCPYLILEWLEGEDLASRQQSRPLKLQEAVVLCRQALEGLAACHAAGIVHRDVKPSNLFLCRGANGAPLLKLIDFGLALAGDMTVLTRAGQLVGTPAYLAPEQARGAQAVDHRADLHAMGLVLYELCTGRRPYISEIPLALLFKIVTESPRPPREIAPSLPSWLEATILQALRKDPAERFASAEAMGAALEGELDSVESAGAVEALLEKATAPTIDLRRPESSTEHRLVSLLCVRPMAGDADASLRAQARASIEAAGGELYPLAGGHLLGLFGAARSVGDEAARALQAGLALRDAALRSMVVTVHLEVGRDLRLDTAELDEALRGLDELAPGALFADETTADLARRELALDDAPREETTRLVRIEGLRREGLGRRMLGRETPTIGRETELAAQRAAFERSIENDEPEVVLVVGQAGIGKTRLCLDLLPELRERAALLLAGRTRSSERQSPYGLFADALGRAARIRIDESPDARREALRAFVHRFAPEDTELVPLLARLLGLEDVSAAEASPLDDPKLMRERIFGAVERLVQIAGGSGPVAFFFEDLQWADEESLDLCVRLLHRLDETPLFVLATTRPELLRRKPEIFSEADATRVELAPLGKRALRRLLRALLGGKVDSELTELVGRWSAGNPYFAEELCVYLLEREMIVHDGGAWRLGGDPEAIALPTGVRGVLQARLDALPSSNKELIKTAAIFGEVFWEDGCAALGFEAAGGALQQPELGELVSRREESRMGGTREWIFRHIFIQQVAYQMLPAARRVELHREAGLWLADRGENDPEVLAFHFEKGDETSRAAEYLARAGERSLREGNLQHAVDVFQRALELGESAPARRAWLRGLSRAQIFLGRYDAALGTLDSIDAADDRVETIELSLLRGRVLYGKARYPDAREALIRGLALADEAEKEELAFELSHVLFYVAFARGRYQEAFEIGERLMVTAQGQDNAYHRCLARMALAYSHVSAPGGDLGVAAELATRAAREANEVGHLFREADALVLSGHTLELLGATEEALETLESARALGRRLQTRHHLAAIETTTARLLANVGKFELARQRAAEAVQLADSLGDGRTQANALLARAMALLADSNASNLDAARLAAERALELAKDRLPAVEAEAFSVLASLHRLAGDHSRAASMAREALRVLDGLEIPPVGAPEILVAAHDALAAFGDEREAKETMERAARAVRKRAEKIADAEKRASYLAATEARKRAAAFSGST